MNSSSKIILGAVVALFLAASNFAGGAETNLVHNGDFSQGTAYWQFLDVAANASGQLDTNVRHDGMASFKFTDKSPQSPNVYARLVQIVSGLQPFATYKISCWVKGKGAGINWIGGGPGWYNRHAFPTGDFDWQPFSFEISTAMFDLNRLAPEVTAINEARPRVALLDSQPSIFWEERYKGTLFSLYTALSFMGEPVTFISERQLATGTAVKVDWLIVPEASHILDTTPAALAAFAKAGGKILLAGKDCLNRDEYNRPLTMKFDYPSIDLGANDAATAASLRSALQPLRFADLRDNATAQPAWGIEFRVVPKGRATLVPMINFNHDKRTVNFPSWRGKQALDLLSGETVDLGAISLEPMLPLLLRIAK